MIGWLVKLVMAFRCAHKFELLSKHSVYGDGVVRGLPVSIRVVSRCEKCGILIKNKIP
jgi:hypothetical protein